MASSTASRVTLPRIRTRADLTLYSFKRSTTSSCVQPSSAPSQMNWMSEPYPLLVTSTSPSGSAVRTLEFSSSSLTIRRLPPGSSVRSTTMIRPSAFLARLRTWKPSALPSEEPSTIGGASTSWNWMS